jgi:hypothetical protein
MTTVRSKFHEYESFNKHVPGLEQQIRSEVLRHVRQRCGPTPSERQRYGLSMIRGPRSKTIVSELSQGMVPESNADAPAYPRIMPPTQYGLATMQSNMTVDDSELVTEQRRLSQTVENVLCAYLNRHDLAHALNDEENTCHIDAADEQTRAVQAHMPRFYQWMPHAMLNATSAIEFHPSLVYLCAPFAQCVRAEAGVYFAFERLMSMIGMIVQILG